MIRRIVAAAALLVGLGGDEPSSDATVRMLTVSQFTETVRTNVAGRGTNSYVPLDDADIAVRLTASAEALLDDRLDVATELLDDLRTLGASFATIEIADADGEAMLGIVERAVPGDPDFKGWGSLLVRPNVACGRVYEAPHVLADVGTETIALQAFLDDTGACAAIFAGAHRYANGTSDPTSDVAHTSDNLLHVLTEHLARRGIAAGNPPWIIQVHGSDDNSRTPNVVTSDGSRHPQLTASSPIMLVQSDVAESGTITLGVCGEPGDDGAPQRYRLCATGNTQGRLLGQLGVQDRFVHLEIDQSTRQAYLSGRGTGYDGLQATFAAIRSRLT